jgi:hypothetical protein
VSEVHDRTAFFDLYQAHSVPEDAIGDFVAAWHNTGNKETRPLSQFLGMTEDEYAIWVIDARTLPLLRTARETKVKFVVAVERYLGELKVTNATADRAAIHALSHWLRQRASPPTSWPGLARPPTSS